MAGWQRLGGLFHKTELLPPHFCSQSNLLHAGFVCIKCVVPGTESCTLGLLLQLPGKHSA